jgi:hypothetical protein
MHRGSISRVAAAVLVGLIGVLTAGCVSKLPASPVQSICDPIKEGAPDPTAKLRPSPDTPLIFPIRLTDDGEYVSRCELTDALLELRDAEAHLTVVYIHGWKHDARKDDTDLKHFGELLSALGAQQAGQAHPLRVVGLYIAWNGETNSAPVLTNLTFWGRKKAADLIAHSAAVTKIVSAVDTIEQRRREANPTLQEVTVYVGHSFGARMLYSAVSQVFIHNVARAFPDTLQGRAGVNVNTPLPPNVPYNSIAGFGRLVLLLNPAFEASFYKPFETLIRPGGRADGSVTREQFFPAQQPVMLTLSAQNDWATKIAFPIGQSVALNTSRIRRTTLGNYTPALTHALARSSGPEQSRSPPAQFWYDNFCAGGICLKRRPDIPETGDPFLVAQARPDIMNGHNGIWRPELRQFVIGFIGELVERSQQAPAKLHP